jgi:hypothetical protein
VSVLLARAGTSATQHHGHQEVGSLSPKRLDNMSREEDEYKVAETDPVKGAVYVDDLQELSRVDSRGIAKGKKIVPNSANTVSRIFLHFHIS